MKKTKRLVATILSLSMMLACSMTTFAAEISEQNCDASVSIENSAVPYVVLPGWVNKTCDVIDDGVALRREAGLDGERLGLLYQADGAWVYTTGEYQYKDGYTWLKVSSSSIGLSGWVAMRYISPR